MFAVPPAPTVRDDLGLGVEVCRALLGHPVPFLTTCTSLPPLASLTRSSQQEGSFRVGNGESSGALVESSGALVALSLQFFGAGDFASDGPNRRPSSFSTGDDEELLEFASRLFELCPEWYKFHEQVVFLPGASPCVRSSHAGTSLEESLRLRKRLRIVDEGKFWNGYFTFLYAAKRQRMVANNAAAGGVKDLKDLTLSDNISFTALLRNVSSFGRRDTTTGATPNSNVSGSIDVFTTPARPAAECGSTGKLGSAATLEESHGLTDRSASVSCSPNANDDDNDDKDEGNSVALVLETHLTPFRPPHGLGSNCSKCNDPHDIADEEVFLAPLGLTLKTSCKRGRLLGHTTMSDFVTKGTITRMVVQRSEEQWKAEDDTDDRVNAAFSVVWV